MLDCALGTCLLNKALQDVRNNNEEVRGQRVALSQAPFALDPGARNTVKQNGGFPRAQNLLNPAAPTAVKTPAIQNGV